MKSPLCRRAFTSVFAAAALILGGTAASAVETPYGEIVGKGDKCVDNPNGYIANGNKTQYLGCNGTDGQRWSFRADGTIQMRQRCLDVAGGSSENGTKIQIMDCNGTP